MRQLLVCGAFLMCGAISACGDDSSNNDDTTDATDGMDSSVDGDASVVTCQQDSECDDGDACTGAETCSDAGVCVAGTPLVCTATDVCHTSVCEAGVGCVETLIDVDDDGFASIDLGSCGTDCDDNDDERAPELEEICDGKDNNCNPSDNETATRWYVDCDEDGFSEALEPSELNCDVAGPSEDHTLCNGQGSKWVTDLAETDCCLLDDRYFPGSDEFIEQRLVLGEVFACEDFDSDCDDTEELEHTVTGISDLLNCVLGPGVCSGIRGWTGDTAPDCGVEAEFSACLLFKDVCGRTTFDKVQRCR